MAKIPKHLNKVLKKYPASLVIKGLKSALGSTAYELKETLTYLAQQFQEHEARKLIAAHPITKQLKKCSIILTDVSWWDGKYRVQFEDVKYVDCYLAEHKKPIDALFTVVSRMPQEVKNKFLV